MPDIYEQLGIRRVINARGTHTRLGGSIMSSQTLNAMREAAKAYVSLDDLQDKASEIIASATGADAGMVTGGAAAGLLFGTAACITGGDPGQIEKLPFTDGLKNEVVMHRAHRNGYDHSVRAAGTKIVEVGYAHLTLKYQLESAFTDKTALVVYLVSPWAGKGALTLQETCETAHRFGVPVLVDAAAALPPAENLKKFIREGADLVTFSGGKGLRGPQSSGILAGRADLISAARLNSSPSHSIGRVAKASKEDIVGLITALEQFVVQDHQAVVSRWREQAEAIMGELEGIPGVSAEFHFHEEILVAPQIEVIIDPSTGIDARTIVSALENHDPRIFLLAPSPGSQTPNSVIIYVPTLQDNEHQIVGKELQEILRNQRQST